MFATLLCAMASRSDLSSITPRLGPGMASLGRPGYLGHADDLPSERTVGTRAR